MRVKWSLSVIFCIYLAMIIAGCSRQPQYKAQGYIEGRYTYIATSVSGVLKQLLVKRGSMVKQGDVLFALEEEPEIDRYNSALENLKQAVAARDAIAANLEYAKITYERYQVLVPKKAIEEARLDNAKSNYQSILAQLAEANANVTSTDALLTQAKWTKDQKKLVSPITGIVFDTYYRVGEYTEEKKAILSLLAPADIKVVFYVNEPMLGKLALGQKISVRCDGCKESFSGQISFISPAAEYTPPVIYSNETNQKLIYRIEGEFAPDVAYNMHPGQPVYVTY